jgi:hypothetical protein
LGVQPQKQPLRARNFVGAAQGNRQIKLRAKVARVVGRLGFQLRRHILRGWPYTPGLLRTGYGRNLPSG